MFPVQGDDVIQKYVVCAISLLLRDVASSDDVGPVTFCCLIGGSLAGMRKNGGAQLGQSCFHLHYTRTVHYNKDEYPAI